MYLIEILHQTTTDWRRYPRAGCCILSKFYIKPQHYDFEKRINYSCILSKFYIKPQLFLQIVNSDVGCILSKFYIKPQQRIRHKIGHSVVSYRNSTSNHNVCQSTHIIALLYLIEILHQTTTVAIVIGLKRLLYLIEILHQTTTCIRCELTLLSCILSKFYIKPQLRRQRSDFCCVVSYRNSTSNHNKLPIIMIIDGVVSYRNSTSNHNCTRSAVGLRIVVSYRNSTSNHNSRYSDWLETFVVSYRNSTSNHNPKCLVFSLSVLYLIEILHQTTTRASY